MYYLLCTSTYFIHDFRNTNQSADWYNMISVLWNYYPKRNINHSSYGKIFTAPILWSFDIDFVVGWNAKRQGVENGYFYPTSHFIATAQKSIETKSNNELKDTTIFMTFKIVVKSKRFYYYYYSSCRMVSSIYINVVILIWFFTFFRIYC